MSLEFQVPQFIEVEDKVFGQLSLKQFLYLAGGAAVIFLLYALLPMFLTILFGLPVAVIAFGLAFYKVNEQPLIKVVENAFKFMSSSRLYIWKKPGVEKKVAIEEMPSQKMESPETTKSRLRDLAWSLDIKEKIR